MLPDIKALRRRLERLRQAPSETHHPRHILFRAKRGLDFIGHARPGPAAFFAAVNPYPKPFEHIKFRTEDGVTIAGWYGPPHPERSEPGEADDAFGLVIVPGMFSTKDDTIHKRRAIRIWRNWKIPVLVIDQRAFGESKGIATAGWKESYDVHGAAKELLRRSGAKRIGVLAESLGGAAALNAVAHDSQTKTNLLTGGTLCFSAFVDARDAVGYISARPPKDHPFYGQWGGFRWLLRLRSHGGYERFDTYLADAARVNGLRDVDELYDLANPKWKVNLMQQPVLCVHASDDPVVPVRHARRMERYATDIRHIATLVTPWGGHTGFEALDPHWFWEVTRSFFEEVNGVALPNLATAK